MKTRMIASFLVIALVAAVIGGASMAYFTAKTDAPVNEFVAGTVMIEAGKEFVWGAEKMDNVNPGDCFSKCVQIYNTGTKAIELRLVGMQFAFDIRWEWICANWDALCFSKVLLATGEKRWADCAAFRDQVEAALEQGQVTNPAEAEGQGYGPFDNQNRLIVPIMSALCPDSGWIMKYLPATKSVVFYYAGGPLARGEVTELCVMVKFDGPWMANLWQGATFTMGGGQFQAIQASNNAPQAMWGQDVWDNYQAVKGAVGAKAQLAYSFGSKYADYFYDPAGNFLFADCCLVTARVRTQEELERALANEEIQRIKLYGTFDGFGVDRSVIIQGGTINVHGPTIPYTHPKGIYIYGNGITVVVDGVTIQNDYEHTANHRGIVTESGKAVNLIVRNSHISGVITGIYLNPGNVTRLTATNNIIMATGAGIGTDFADMTGDISDNTFDPGVEGIGLNQPVWPDGTVMTLAEAQALKAALEAANTDCNVNVYGL